MKSVQGNNRRFRLTLALTAAGLWFVVCLAPYLVIGETWGMVWMPLNMPMSLLIQEMPVATIAYPILFVGATTTLNAILIGAVVFVLTSLFRAIRDWRRARHSADASEGKGNFG